ncbi:unnamed protein product [marine sediment metagenome]|uniref:Orc1-like AAA ATPase domain-containing protein n=1 Tax=marine sediment metagenome TaxID=412755 RepID=X0ZDC2_9ZZZZ
MKYAIVEDGGKQYKAVEGETVEIDRFQAEIGEQVDLDRVLLISDGENTSIGDTVNLARRLQETANVDSILVSESVYQGTEALFEYELQPELLLKGYQHSQNGYHLLGSKSEPGLVRGIQGLRSPMVGRDAELEYLLGALNDLDQNQRGQFVTLIGEAGIGKSRLTTEFKANIDSTKMNVLEGQSLTYRKSVSYWIFLELLRDYLGVTPGTSNTEVRERLVSRVNQTLGSEAGEVLPFLEHLLSLESSDGEVAQRLSYLDAEQLRKQTFIALRNLLLAEARQKPLILILEDLHWVDEVSLDLLAFLLDSIDDLPIFVYQSACARFLQYRKELLLPDSGSDCGNHQGFPACPPGCKAIDRFVHPKGYAAG